MSHNLTDRALQLTTRARPYALLFATSALLLPAMAWVNFHTYASFDDEGYDLLLLASLANHQQALYSQLYAAYGPAYYVLFDLMFNILRLPFTADAARVVTVLLWALTCFLTGWLVWVYTRSYALAITAVVVSYMWVSTLGTSVLYPGLLLISLQIALALAITQADRRHGRVALFTSGGLIASILLIKVNVGIFTIAALGVSIGIGVGRVRVPTPLWYAICGLALAVPPALMVGLMGHAWVTEYLLASESGVASLLCVGGLFRPRRQGPKSPSSLALWITMGLCLVSLGYFGIVTQAGTPLRAILLGTFVNPVDQFHFLVVPIPLGPLRTAVTVLMSGGITLYTWNVRHLTNNAAQTPRCDRWRIGLALLKIGAGGTIVAFGLSGGLPWSPVVGVALMGLAACGTPTAGASGTARPLILVSASLGVFEQLQMYPVAGAQIAAGTFWIGIAALLMLYDGIVELQARTDLHHRPEQLLDARRPFVIAAATLAVTCFIVVATWSTLASTEGQWTSLQLPGSSAISLPPHEATTLQLVVAYLKHNCTTFISAPGLDSLYTWTREPVPPGLVDDDWMYVVPPSSQAHILNALQARLRVCGVENPAVMRIWRHGRPLPPSPILDYLRNDFVVVTRIGNFVLLRRY